MMALSMERLAAIRARADAATPGPWRVDEGIAHSDPGFPEDAIWYRQIDGWRDLGPEHGCDWLWLSREDATFIAHAREDIPALLAEVERLRAEIAALREAVVRAAHDLTWTATLYAAGDAEVVATVVASLLETRDALQAALDGGAREEVAG